MKNPLLIILILITCFIALVSCGSEQDSSINSSESSSQSSSQSDSYTESQSESTSEKVSEQTQTETQTNVNGYRIEHHLTKEVYELTIEEVTAIKSILFSENSVWEDGCCDCASFVTIHWNGRKLEYSQDAINDSGNWIRFLLTEEQSEQINAISEKYFGKVYRNLTRDHFATAYQSWTGDYYNLEIPEEATRPFYYVKAFFNYDDFAKGVVDSNPTGVTEQTFEDNFVLVISGLSPHIRTEDVYYTDFSKQDGYYTITYNKVSSEYMDFAEAVDPFCDVCIIPKELCDTPKANFKVIEKEYIYFSDENGTLYTGSCKMYQETFDVIGDYRIENRSTKEQVNLISEEIATINNILFSENSVWEDGCCDCISPIIIHWNGRKLEVSNHAINDAGNWIRFLLTEEQSEKISKIAEKYFGDYDK